MDVLDCFSIDYAHGGTEEPQDYESKTYFTHTHTIGNDILGRKKQLSQMLYLILNPISKEFVLGGTLFRLVYSIYGYVVKC